MTKNKMTNESYYPTTFVEHVKIIGTNRSKLYPDLSVDDLRSLRQVNQLEKSFFGRLISIYIVFKV